MTIDETSSFPDWVYRLLEEPEQNDSEWGRSCHFCGSTHGRYDAPLEHYIDCPWLLGATRAGVDTTGHIVFVPTPNAECAACGWYYNSREEWRGREDEMPPPADPALSEIHDTHIAVDHGITLEQFRGNELYWMHRWMMQEVSERMIARFTEERGGISYIQPPDLSDEAIRSLDA